MQPRTETASQCQPCGNPNAVAELRQGEKNAGPRLGRWDRRAAIGSSSRRAGFAHGVDMADEMLDLDRANAAQGGATNIEFLKGTIEDIPLPDESVDVVITNCVIRLSVDEPKGDHRDVPGAQPSWPDRHQRCSGRGSPQRRGAGRARLSAASRYSSSRPEISMPGAIQPYRCQ
jgi:SAM-dependent methyltransferase